MKKLRVKGLFFAILLLATLILLVACGGGDEDVTTKKPTATTAEPAATTTVPATSVTKPIVTTQPAVTTAAPGGSVTTVPVTTAKPTVTTASVVTTAPVTTTVPVTTSPHYAVAEWTAEDGVHYRVCADGCSIRYDVGACGGGEATCQAAAVCATCGQGYGEISAHKSLNGECKYCKIPMTSEGLWYDLLEDGTYAVMGIGTCTDVILVIPDTYEGKAVTSIGWNAFGSCGSLISVTIGDSVTSIGNSAFSGCTGLTSVTIGDSVTSIGDHAFYNCSSLEAVYISDLAAWCEIEFGYDGNPLYYAHHLYLNSTLLTELVIPDSVTTINENAFAHCHSLTSVTIPDSVTSIGSEAFQYCYKLVEVRNLSDLTITKGAQDNGDIGQYALNIITDATTPSKIWETSDGYLFYEDGETCYLLGYTGSETDLTLPADCHGKEYEIYQYAFRGCSSLTSVTIPDSVTSIGSYAFYNCTSLTSVTIGDSVTSIGAYAFRGCSSLTSVNFETTEGWKAGSTALSATKLADTATAATYLRSTYYDYTWTRE